MNHAIFPRRAAATLLAMLAAALSGCASTSPQADSHFGSAVRAAVATQTLDPGAARNTSPVNGMDGTAAVAAYITYGAAFQQKTEALPPLVGGGKK